MSHPGNGRLVFRLHKQKNARGAYWVCRVNLKAIVDISDASLFVFEQEDGSMRVELEQYNPTKSGKPNKKQ